MLNSSQSKVAEYRYDPFGNLISSSGTLASANVYRFSSKEIHVNSGMYYYLYRFYDPNLQRWNTRDPLAEKGFERIQRPAVEEANADVNLYCFVHNGPVDSRDAYGLSDYTDCVDACDRKFKEKWEKTCNAAKNLPKLGAAAGAV